MLYIEITPSAGDRCSFRTAETCAASHCNAISSAVISDAMIRYQCKSGLEASLLEMRAMNRAGPSNQSTRLDYNSSCLGAEIL